jgi:hypothetical protein
MARRTAAVAALALTALGACADPASPDIKPALGPSSLHLSALKSGAAASGARSNRAEPMEVADRGRFNVAFKYLVPPTPAQRAVFDVAAARWERTIIKDVPSVSGELPSCFNGLPPVSTTVVDDVVIEVALVPIDGPGKVLGAAGPCFIRNVDALTVSGVMFFDTADLAFLESLGLFDEVIVHEMGHVLGIGTLWNDGGRTLSQGPASNPYFTGKTANTHWHAEGGVGLLPIENIGGPGTAGGHWRESVLRNELMTGFLNLGVNPLSRITAGSLRDMGYGVGIVGEQYALERGAQGVVLANAASGSEGVNIRDGEVMLSPIGVVMEAGAP